MSWVDRYFGGDDYVLLEGIPSQAIAEQCTDFMCETLEVGPGSRVLDVGCGMGRYSIALAKRGCLVTGIDSSPYMLAECMRLAECEPRFTIREMDFHETSFRDEFDAVLCWGNCLGYGSREDDAEAVRGMVAALVRGGRILIDLHNLPWYRRNGVGQSWRETDDYFMLSEMIFDEGAQKLVSREIIVPKNGSPPREYPATYLQYKPSEIADLLSSSGMIELKFYGDACASAGGPLFCPEGYNEQSHMMIVGGTKGNR